jgi:hypothetical protein
VSRATYRIAGAAQLEVVRSIQARQDVQFSIEPATTA